jgi:hypothetical protein
MPRMIIGKEIALHRGDECCADGLHGLTEVRPTPASWWRVRRLQSSVARGGLRSTERRIASAWLVGAEAIGAAHRGRHARRTTDRSLRYLDPWEDARRVREGDRHPTDLFDKPVLSGR